MARYSRLVLQFFFGLSHSLRRVESFVFGTRLTRITPQLKLRNIDRALEAVRLASGRDLGEIAEEDGGDEA